MTNLFSEKWFYRILFICLFTYAILRAWLVVPLFDEIATFFNYIRTADYFNANGTGSANNHVLNSFFGNFLFEKIGDYFFLFRLSSLLALAIYFFANKYIIQETFQSSSLRIVVFISVMCIPWIFEYFSYSRGYGMAIAFYFGAIAFILKWKSDDSWISLLGFFTCIWFSIASNLSYILPSLILVVYFEFIFIFNGKFGKRILYNLFILLLWGAATIPFLKYSFKLKEAGALWWSNQDGLWETTGKSLSKLVLFTSNTWVLYVILTLIFICLISFINRWRKRGVWAYLKESEAMIFIIFTGSLTGFVLMCHLLDVNYPMDRVAMYLVPVFILMISVFLSKSQNSKHLLWGLLFFPLSFIYHLNLSTSIFSPEDRIPNSFLNRIKSSVSDQNALSADYVSHMSYAYANRKKSKVHIAYTLDEKAINYGDFHISWLGGKQVDGYDLIYKHPDSKTCLIKKNQVAEKKIVVDKIIKNVKTTNQYLTILKESIDSSLLGKTMQVKISGDIEFDQPTMGFNVIQKILNKNNETLSNSAPRFNWYFSDRTNANFVFTDRIVKLKPEESKFNFFLMNNDLNKINIKFIRVQIYLISY